MFYLTYKDKDITVYEESDLSTIFDAILYKIRLKGITKNKSRSEYKSPFYYKDFACYDTETTTLDLTAYTNIFENKQGVCYLNQFYIAGYVIFIRKMSYFVHFLNRLKNELGEHILVIYVHNLSFEWQFLKSYIDIKEIFATKERAVLKFLTHNNIEFRCSYKLSNMSLEKFSEKYSSFYIKEKDLMNYEKVRLWNTELDENTRLYSALDVLSLYESLENFFKINHIKIYDNLPTSTSLVRKDVRETMLSKDNKKRTKEKFKEMKLCAETYNLTEKLKAGGNTHANREHVNRILQNVGHCDITSAYPFCMICLPLYSQGKYTREEINKDGHLDFEYYMYLRSQKKIVISTFNVLNLRLRKDVYVPIPYLSISRCKGVTEDGYNNDNGRLLYNIGITEFSMYDMEFVHCFLSQYEFDDIVAKDSYVCKRGFLPATLRQETVSYFKKKTALKGIKDKDYEYTKSKNNLNGIYGCIYTNPVRDRILLRENNTLYREKLKDVSIEEYELMTFEEREEIRQRNITDSLESFYKGKKNFLTYQWGSQTAMLGRVYLQKIIDSIDRHDVVYTDTDSVFYLNPEKNERSVKEISERVCRTYEEKYNDIPAFEYNMLGVKSTLGEITIEETADRFKTLGAKKYCQEIDGKFEITIAGVSKDLGSIFMKSVDNFNIGFVFDERVGKKRLIYNDNERVYTIKYQETEIEVGSNVAFERTTYHLGITDNYSNILEHEKEITICRT